MDTVSSGFSSSSSSIKARFTRSSRSLPYMLPEVSIRNTRLCPGRLSMVTSSACRPIRSSFVFSFHGQGAISVVTPKGSPFSGFA